MGTNMNTLRARAMYAVRQNIGYTVAIENIKAISPKEAVWWTDFASKARAAVENFVTYTSVPSGIPASGHAFVILGSGLAANGTMKKKLIRRLDIALEAAKKYPNSKIVVSGGAPKRGITEAYRMKEYLVDNKVSPSRIIYEDKSSSTVSNGRNSVELMIKNKVTSYTIISDSSHLRRATLIFEAAKLRWQYVNGRAVTLKMVKNFGYPDQNNPKVANTATRDTVFLFAAYAAMLTTAYATAVAKKELTYPTLRVGSKGAWVKSLQSKLKVVADGAFGPKTQAAVKAYQKSKGLKQDGVAGPLTLKALGVTAK